MVDFGNLFWLILAVLIVINSCLFLLAYLRVSNKNHKSNAKRGFAAEKKAEHECLHFFGYLADEHPRDKPIPKECFGCPSAVDCINKHVKENKGKALEVKT